MCSIDVKGGTVTLKKGLETSESQVLCTRLGREKCGFFASWEHVETSLNDCDRAI